MYLCVRSFGTKFGISRYLVTDSVIERVLSVDRKPRMRTRVQDQEIFIALSCLYLLSPAVEPESQKLSIHIAIR
jgi:hypothetical protein